MGIWEDSKPITETKEPDIWTQSKPLSVPEVKASDVGKPEYSAGKSIWDQSTPIAKPSFKGITGLFGFGPMAAAKQKGLMLAADREMGEDEAFNKMSPLMKVIDTITRPGYAFKAVLSRIQDDNLSIIADIDKKYAGEYGSIITPETNVKIKEEKRTVLLNRKPKIMRDLVAAYKGLTGKERHSMNELFEKVGIKGVPLLGFVAELGADPLMYGGYTAINKIIGEAAGGVKTAAMEVPAIRQAAVGAKEMIEPAVELFTTKSRIPELGNLIDRWLSERHWLKGREIQYAARTRLAVNNIATKTGMKSKEVGQRIANIIELRYHPDELAKVVPNISTEERVLANTLQSHYTNLLIDEMRKGVPIDPLSSVRTVKVARLRKNLETVRGSYQKELTKTRKMLVRELDVYSEQQLRQYTAKLEGTQAKIEDTAYRTHLENVKKLDKAIDSVDAQMMNLEKLRLKALKGGGRAISVQAEIDRTVAKLENLKMLMEPGVLDTLTSVVPATAIKSIKKEGFIASKSFSNKPSGVWLSINNSWENWLKSEQPNWLKGKTSVPVTIKPGTKLLEIKDLQELKNLFAKYNIPWDRPNYNLESFFDKVKSEGYKGIKYIETIKLRLESPFYGWDTDSIVIFDPKNVIYGKVIQKTKTTDFSAVKKSMSELLKRKKLLDNALSDLKASSADPIINIDKQLSKLENQFWYLHSEMADRLQDIPELSKGSIFVKQIDDIANLLKGDIEVNLGERGVSLAKKIMEIEKRAGKLPQTELGIPTRESRKLLKQLTVERAKREFGYFPRITTDEAKQIILSMRIGRSKLWSNELVNALRRRTEDFTLEEFNEFVQAHGLKSLEGRTIEQFFLTDPAWATAIRGVRSAKAVTSAEFLREAGEKFGTSIREAPLNYIILPDHVLKLNPTLKGLAFPQEVASEIGRMTEFYMNPSYRPDVWGRFAKHFDVVQNLWKRWQLAVFPKYHLRNVVGNLWNNFLADVDPSQYPKAIAIQAYRKYRHTPFYADISKKGLHTLGISIDDADRLISQMERLGVVEGGWYAADIDFSIRQALGKGGISGRGMAVGRTLENNARVAHFLDRMARGKSIEEAALSVKKYLFDYSDLTHFERTILKRLMPFYSWTRKNIPLQLESLYKTPEKFAPIGVPIRQRDPKDLLRLKYSNPALYNRLPLELQRSIDTVTYIPLEGLLPMADLSKMNRPQDLIYELLTPFLKEPIEQLFNKDLYSGRPIERYKGETQPLYNVDIPVRIRHLLTTVLPSARITRELDKLVTKRKGKIPLNATEWAFASTLSTVYKSDISSLKNIALSKVMNMIEELKSGARRAKMNGREEEYKAILKTIDEAVKEINKLK